MTNIDYTYYGKHFVIHVKIESLCHTPETNMLYVNYISIKISERTHSSYVYVSIQTLN